MSKKKQETQVIGVREARIQLLGLCREMCAGERTTPIIITHRGTPAAKLSPMKRAKRG